MLEGIHPVRLRRWANACILETADKLTPEQFAADADGCGSIRDTLVHTASVQWLWLERWHGTSPRELWDPADFPDIAALRARWGRGRGSDIGVYRSFA